MKRLKLQQYIFSMMADLQNKLRSRYVEEFFCYEIQQLKNLGADEERKIVEDFKSFPTMPSHIQKTIDFNNLGYFSTFSYNT